MKGFFKNCYKFFTTHLSKTNFLYFSKGFRLCPKEIRYRLNYFRSRPRDNSLCPEDNSLCSDDNSLCSDDNCS